MTKATNTSDRTGWLVPCHAAIRAAHPDLTVRVDGDRTYTWLDVTVQGYPGGLSLRVGPTWESGQDSPVGYSASMSNDAGQHLGEFAIASVEPMDVAARLVTGALLCGPQEGGGTVTLAGAA